MHYLVTGGAGFIGTNLCERLIKEGHSVIALDNLSVSDVNVSFLESLGVTVVVQDIVSYEAIEPFFKDVDVVIHLAAMNRAQRSIEKPLEANAVNIDGTLNCLEASRHNQVDRFVNISSSSVYASQRDVLLKEDMALAPPHPYGVGKLAGEHYTRIYRDIYELNTVSLRFFSVYGPRQLGGIDKAGVVAKFIHHAMTGAPIEIYGDGKQLRNFSYVEDVVECVLRASTVKSAIGEVINIASPQEIDVNTLATLVGEVTGKELEIVHRDVLIGDPSRNPANTQKCQDILDFVPRFSFKEGISSSFEWYKKSR
jgi:UDP-glucose 4-epimerase